MPKKYFCENLVGLDICGEDNPENFSKGRYTRCKRCRNADTRERLREKRELSKDESIETKVEEIKDGRKIQLLIEDIVIGKPLMQGGFTISDSIYRIETNFSSYRKIVDEVHIQLNQRVKKLEIENEYYKKENQKLQKEISSIKNFLEEKFEKYFESV